MEEVRVERRDVLRYGFGLLLVLFFSWLPGCRNLLEQFEKDKKKYPAGTPLGVLVRKGYRITSESKGDWQTKWGVTFDGTIVRTVNGTPTAVYDVIDTNGYVDPTTAADKYALGNWQAITWYDYQHQALLTITPA